MPRSRLSALDASFLRIETPTLPMHAGGVGFFEGDRLRDGNGALRLDEIRSLVEARLPRLPKLTHRLHNPLGPLARPVWVEDERFDITRHVRVLPLAAPCSERELCRLVATLHMEPLDRRYPLWDLTLVDGLADGRIALIERIHHALADGIAGVDATALILDPTPDTPGTVAGPLASTPPRRTLHGMMAEAAARAEGIVRSSLAAARILPAAPALLSLAGRAVAPRSALNHPVGDGRAYEMARSSLDDAKAAAASAGAKANDVVLAAVAGALRQVVVELMGWPASSEVQILVPVSVRSDRSSGRLGNEVSGLLVRLRLDITDPAERLAVIRDQTVRLKQSGEAAALGALLAAAELLPEPLAFGVGALVRRQPFVNMVVTNVPGPPAPLYLLGARMLDAFPVVPLSSNLSLNVGILSYAGELNFGLMADRGHARHAALLAEGIEKHLNELAGLARHHSNGGTTS